MGIRVVGELELLPLEVRRAACNAMYATRNYSRYILNVCLSYTSTAEVLNASNSLLQAVQQNLLLPSDITSAHISQLMYTNPPPEVLVRTSGERRLSDFFTWQCTQRPAPTIAFVDALWPDFGLRHMALAILRYQIAYPMRAIITSREKRIDEPERWEKFLATRERDRWNMIVSQQTIELPTPPQSPCDRS